MTRKIIPLIFCIIFLILSLQNTYEPGISIDEADEAIACDLTFKNYSPIAKTVLIGPYVVIFNKIFPIMHGSYAGRVHAYLMLIFSRIFGVNVFTVRFTSIAVSAITLIFIYFLCRMWFGYRVAVVTVLLSATNLLFVQYSRVGYYREEVFVIFFFWAGFFFLAKYLMLRRPIFLYLSFFLFGLGLSTKFTMLFYIAGLGATLVLLRKGFNLRWDIKRIVLSLVSFCLGAFQLILYNIISGGESVKFLLNALRHYTIAGYNNLAYFINLWERVTHLIYLLEGYISERDSWGVIQSSFIERIAPIFIGLFFVSFFFVFLYAIFLNKNSANVRYRILFFYIFYGIVFLLTPFAPKGLSPGHLLVLLPFPQILIALFLEYMRPVLKNRTTALPIMYSVFLIPFLVFNIWMNIYFYAQMKKNGGYGRWSTTIYELSQYMNDKKIYSPVTFGFGLQENIVMLSGYRVIPQRFDEYSSSESVIKGYHKLSLTNEPIFLLVKGSEEYIPNFDLFISLAEGDGKSKALNKIFLNKAGEPVYWLYKIY